MFIRDYAKNHRDNVLMGVFLVIGFYFLAIALCMQSIPSTLEGMKVLLTHSNKLISDGFALVGYGPTFLNASLLFLISTFIIYICKVKLSGITIASVLLMGGFGFFGKNIVNIWPILFGVYLYAKINKQKFSRYIYIGFFGTCLAPLVNEVVLWQSNIYIGIALAIIVGVVVGFLLVPISSQTLHVHQGYNLYNVGFSAGIIGMIIISLMKSFGYQDVPQKIWSYESNTSIILLMYGLFLGFLVFAFVLDKNCIASYKLILKKSGRLISDFLTVGGLAGVLFNMGLLGIVYTTFILAVGGTLNGPTIGGILTVVGFGGFGKHIRNTVPITLGVLIGAYLKIWNLNDPSVILALLFSTGLSPIAGQFGFVWGVVAGFLHLSLVLGIGMYHGGVNLYNNGFSAGFIALFLVPVIEALKTTKRGKSK